MLAEARAEAPSAARPLGCQAGPQAASAMGFTRHPPTRSLIYSFTLLPPAPLSRLREMTGPQAGRRRTARAWHRPFRQDKRPPDSQAPHETSQNANQNGSLVFRKSFSLLFPPLHAPSNGFVFIPRLSFLPALLLPIPTAPRPPPGSCSRGQQTKQVSRLPPEPGRGSP